MRIIGGLAKGVILKTLVHKSLRPTSQKVREALFSIVQDRIYGCDFLDVFAGVGTVGIEALSRGARSAVFLEKNKKALFCLYHNIETAKVKEVSVVLPGDAIKNLNRLERNTFDLIFLDPPYNFLHYQKVLGCIMEKGILRKGGIIIVEHYHKNQTVLPDGIFFFVRQKKYGETMLSFLG